MLSHSRVASFKWAIARMKVEKGLSEEIFYTALEILDPESRTAYLDTACNDDPQLRTNVENLLRYHAQAEGFLETPAVQSPIDLPVPSPAEGPGAMIGRYRLLEKIGEGGMAVVYMAEQEQPLRRKVALKLVKLGMDSAQVIARFEAERQALALMDHPNIARVFDAGTTDTGRPYFVMELVKGLSITRFCDTNQLSTRERLALLVTVCQAVQHAHQKGIIHRDIKPSNVMVTLHEGQAVPKVIDFGIAKATNRRLTEKTLFTHYAQIIGTPEYMSPEQAELSDMDVDTRTDVYSLGVLLYEILTGRPPFEAKYLRGKSYAEIQRIIREEEPTRPSTKVRALGEGLGEIAKQRQTSPEALHKLMRTDLDWIVMKTLEKQRDRRYDSVSEFASDIERHLKHEPVLAGPPSAWYALKKYVQRHRAHLTTVMAVLLTLLVGLSVGVHLLGRVQRVESAADLERHLFQAQLLHAQGLFQAALAEIEQPQWAAEAPAEAKLLRAQILFDLNRWPAAEAILESLTDREPRISGTAHYLLSRIMMGTDPNRAALHGGRADQEQPNTAETYCLRALASSGPNEALMWLNRALELDPAHYGAHQARAFTYYSLFQYENMAEDATALVVLRSGHYLGYALRAIVRRETGRFDKALEDHDRAISLCTHPEELSNLYEQRRETYMRQGNYQAALDDAKRGVNHPGAVFCALFGLADYNGARKVYEQCTREGSVAARHFHAAIECCAADLLIRDPDFAIPPSVAVQTPFHLLEASLRFYRSLMKKGRVMDGMDASWLGSWSPDGRQIAFARFRYQPGIGSGYRGMPSYLTNNNSIEVRDLESGNAHQIAGFGNHPVWSPDGKYIAFSDYNNGNPAIWLVPSDGGEPRRLGGGFQTQWSMDSKRVYFITSNGSTICSVEIDDPDAVAQPVLPFTGSITNSFALAPDGRRMAIFTPSEIRVMTFPDGDNIVRWELPWPVMDWTVQLQWHPDGRRIVFNSFSDHNQLGIQLFDVDTATAAHVLHGTRPSVRTLWSPDGSRLIIDSYADENTWLLNIDPYKPLLEELAPSLGTEALLSKLLVEWDRIIAADPCLAENRVARAVIHTAAGDWDRAQEDLQQAQALIRDPNDPTLGMIRHWSRLYCLSRRYDEAEFWSLAHMQLAERFPQRYQDVSSSGHPYGQLMRTYMSLGDRSKIEALQERCLFSFPKPSSRLLHDVPSDTYTLAGAGLNIGGYWDQFHFASKRLQGNGGIEVKIEGLDDAKKWSRAGIMIRASLDPASEYVTILLSPDGKLEFRYRPETEGQTIHINSGPVDISLPLWLRLRREGNRFTAERSLDGIHWFAVCPLIQPDKIEPVDIAMNDTIHIGLATFLFSDPSSTAKARFSQVRMLGMTTPDGPIRDMADIGF